MLLAGGCKNSAGILQDQNEGGWFAKKVDIFAKPDWGSAGSAQVSLGPQGPVGAEDLVSGDGRCAVTAPSAQVVEPTQAEASSEQTSAVTPAAPPPDKLELAAPQVAGGIALGMTECQAVQRAGVPNNVALSTGDKGERKVVLTFLSGPWPGIYTFADGRLKVIERAPEQPKPASAPAKKTPKKKSSTPKTANHEIQRSYVQ